MQGNGPPAYQRSPAQQNGYAPKVPQGGVGMPSAGGNNSNGMSNMAAGGYKPTPRPSPPASTGMQYAAAGGYRATPTAPGVPQHCYMAPPQHHHQGAPAAAMYAGGYGQYAQNAAAYPVAPSLYYQVPA